MAENDNNADSINHNPEHGTGDGGNTTGGDAQPGGLAPATPTPAATGGPAPALTPGAAPAAEAKTPIYRRRWAQLVAALAALLVAGLIGAGIGYAVADHEDDDDDDDRHHSHYEEHHRDYRGPHGDRGSRPGEGPQRQAPATDQAEPGDAPDGEAEPVPTTQQQTPQPSA